MKERKWVLAVKLVNGRMPSLPGRRSRIPEIGDVMRRDDGRAYVITNVRTSLDSRLIVTIESGATA